MTEAAQEVQRSGYPSAYAVYEGDARALASALTGYSPAAFWCHLPKPGAAAPPPIRRAAGLRDSLEPAFGTVEVRVGSGNRLEVPTSSTARGWAVASYLVAHAAQLGISSVVLPRPGVVRGEQSRLAARLGLRLRGFRRDRVRPPPDPGRGGKTLPRNLVDEARLALL